MGPADTDGHRDDVEHRHLNGRHRRPPIWSGGPFARQAQRPLAWASWVAAALTVAYIALSFPSPLGIFFAVSLPLLMLFIPATAIVLVVVLAQEISSSGGHGALTTLGNHAFYGPGKIPIILALGLVAALAAAARSERSTRVRLGALDATMVCAAIGLVVLSFVYGLLNGQSPLSAGNQNARPFVLLLLGLVVGLCLRWLKAEAGPLTKSVAVALTGLLVAAAIAVPLGESADARVSRYFIYYDAALPAIAAAVFLALLGARRRWSWQTAVVAVSMPLLVLVSFRRSVWIAAVLALAVVLVVGWSRWKQMLGRLVFAGVATAIVVIAAPGFAQDLGLRSEPGLEFTQGTPPKASPSTPPSGAPTTPKPAATKPAVPENVQHQAASTSGHIEDLRLGWVYVKDNFWTGVGPVAPQLPGLAAKDAARVYVHNELLQVWLRYGPLGALLVAVFLAAGGLIALRALRDRDSDVIVRSAAAMCLIAPLCLMTAPFLSDTSRWPLLIGIAAGILVLRPVNQAPAGSVVE